ncbi:MAG TPA: hypothetical protein VD838_01445 [Anaeromyxobacteraceae bacterium]|nr:hypothetical protein [Anaeromyxobacteraceae bacterium]
MKAADFPGLECPDCGEMPTLSYEEGVGPQWAVICACGASGPDANTAPEAVAAWEAGQRYRRSTRRGRERARELASSPASAPSRAAGA